MSSAEITTPSDREIAMTRVFDAPRKLVFEAYTRPELLKSWLARLRRLGTRCLRSRPPGRRRVSI